MWSIEIIAYCAVNSYALISGYTMSSVQLKLDRLFQIWKQVLFYSIGLGLVVGLIRPDILSERRILSMIFPIISGEYWYISCYFIVFLFSPIINSAVSNLEKSVLMRIVIGLAILQCIMPEKIFINTYGMNSGFSALWLIQMYLIGNILKKYGLPSVLQRNDKIIFLFTIAMTIMWKYFFESILVVPQAANLLVSYMSPTIILMALSLFSMGINVKIHNPERLHLQKLAAATLGVYLFHEHPMIREVLIMDICYKFHFSNISVLLGEVFGLCMIIFIAGIILDAIRNILFANASINNKLKLK